MINRKWMDGGLNVRLSIEIHSWAQFTFEWTAVGTNLDRWSCRRSDSSHKRFYQHKMAAPVSWASVALLLYTRTPASSVFICANGPNDQAMITKELSLAENSSNERSEKFSAFF